MEKNILIKRSGTLIVDEIMQKIIEAGCPKVLQIDEFTKATRIREGQAGGVIQIKIKGNWYKISYKSQGGIII